MAEWISVKDRLPNEEEIFLVYNGKSNDSYIELGFWNLDKKRFEYYDNEDYGLEMYDITHWMPLPKPPKESDVK